MERRKVGVVLSGCGFKDGSEIHEAVLVLLAIDRHGGDWTCFAPDADQAQVIDHVRMAPVAGERIADLATAHASDLDALVMPGGFGAATNLSDFASRGESATVHPDVARLLREMHAAKKPIGAVCIAPAVVARVLGEHRPKLTVGEPSGASQRVAACGAVHQASPVDQCVIDRANRIVTAPAYMVDARLGDVAKGIDRCVAEVLAMAQEAAPVAR